MSNTLPETNNYVTSAGLALTLENAGYILSRYLQAFGRNPSQFRHTVSYIITPPPSPCLGPCIVRPHPPPGPAFDAILTLPPDSGSILNFTSAGPYPTKLMAKRAAAWSACRSLLDRGELEPDFSPMPGGEKPPEKKAKIKVREGRDVASLARWVDEGDRILRSDPGSGDVSGGSTKAGLEGLTKTQRWDVFKGAVKDRLPEPSRGVNGGPSGEGVFEMLGTPEALLEKVGRRPWVTVLRLKGERVLALLSAKRLVQGSEELEVGNAGAKMRMTDWGQLKKLSEEQFDSACRYTERVIRSQLNKDLCRPQDGPHWLIVPLLRSFVTTPPAGKVSRTDIDWAEITTSLGPLFYPFTPGDATALEGEVYDAIATYPSELGQRFYIDSLTDLTAASPHPTHPERTILQSSTRKLPVDLVHPEQRALRVSIASSGGSGGIIAHPSSPADTYLLPELYQRYAFPQSTYRALSTLPLFFLSLRFRLIAADFNSEFFSGSLQPDLVLQALTPSMSAPGRPEASYERLEALGDTLLKLITTIDFCLAGPLTDELRVERYVVLSNRSLWAGGVKVGLPKYLKMSVGKPKGWVPDGWTLGQRQEALADSGVVMPPVPAAKKEKETVRIGDKIVADAVEAVVGAAYLSADRSLDAAISSMKRLLIPIDRINVWADIGKLEGRANTLSVELELASTTSNANGIGTAGASKKFTKRDHADRLETGWMSTFTRPVGVDALGYVFRDTKRADTIFDLALRTSDAYLKYKLVGDALLDYFIMERLWDVTPAYSPAIMTHMRHSRASDQALAAMSVCLGLGQRVRGVDDELIVRMRQYDAEIRARWKDAKKILNQLEWRRKEQAEDKVAHANTPVGGEEVNGRLEEGPTSLDKVTEFWTGINYTSHLGALPEVLLGAILVDTGGALEPGRKVFDEHFWPFLDTFGVGPIKHSLHPKSVLQERLGAQGCVGWEIETLEGGRGVTRVVKVHGKEIGRASAESGPHASRTACENALKGMKDEEIKAGCTCRPRA